MMKAILAQAFAQLMRFLGQQQFDILALLASTRFKLAVIFLGLAWVIADRERWLMFALAMVVALMVSDTIRPFREKLEDLFRDK